MAGPYGKSHGRLNQKTINGRDIVSKHARQMAERRGLDPAQLEEKAIRARTYGLELEKIPEKLHPYARDLLSFFDEIAKTHEARTYTLPKKDYRQVVFDGCLFVLSGKGKFSCVTVKPLPEELLAALEGAKNRKQIIDVLWKRAQEDGHLRNF